MYTFDPSTHFVWTLKSNELSAFHRGLVRDFQNILTTSDVHLFGHMAEVGDKFMYRVLICINQCMKWFRNELQNSTEEWTLKCIYNK
jgi:hypothetical protein